MITKVISIAKLLIPIFTEITSYHIGCTDKPRNNPVLKRDNINDQRNLLMISIVSHFRDPQTRFRVGTSPNVIRSHLSYLAIP